MGSDGRTAAWGVSCSGGCGGGETPGVQASDGGVQVDI